ncbi:MAG: component of SufBCD complex [Paracoccaceae bacterium]
MDLYRTVFEVIDMRSFSNLWFWIALAVMWSTASHWVLGIPFDMVTRARRLGGQADRDLHDLVRINVNRMLYITGVAGVWVLGFLCFILSALLMLGFWYRVEFAQALFLLGFPMSLVWAISLRAARRIRAREETGPDLYRRLKRVRIATQAIGMISIFVTALWGMYQNLSIGVLDY